MGISELTALELGKEIKEKRISVREAVQASLERIHKYEDTVHAYVTLTEEAALAQADEIQKQIDDGTLTGPLAGVPMAIKDNICTEGIETTCSSKILRGFVPPYSAEAALNLKKAGAILLGKTNMDEFAMGSTTETSAYGVTRNPWDLEHVPGGSSGGSCAAVSEIVQTCNSDRIAIVAHGGTMMAVFSACEMHHKSYFDWKIPHCEPFLCEVFRKNPLQLQWKERN